MATNGSVLPSADIAGSLVSQHRPQRHLNIWAALWTEHLQRDLAQLSALRLPSGRQLDCCTESHPACLPLHVDGRCVGLVRALPAPELDCVMRPAAPLSAASSYLDLETLYGSSEQAGRQLRTLSGGRLRTDSDSDSDSYPGVTMGLRRNGARSAPDSLRERRGLGIQLPESTAGRRASGRSVIPRGAPGDAEMEWVSLGPDQSARKDGNADISRATRRSGKMEDSVPKQFDIEDLLLLSGDNTGMFEDSLRLPDDDLRPETPDFSDSDIREIDFSPDFPELEFKPPRPRPHRPYGYKGPPGKPGKRGPTGPRGPRGPNGKNGMNGGPGLNGSPGAQGEPGIQGPPGDRGDVGPMGPPGRDGQPGATGEPGVTGPPGKPGVNGTPGIPGEAGKPGQRGETGQPGLPGRQGPVGPKGPHGKPGLPGQPGRHRRKGSPWTDGPTRREGTIRAARE